jgi:hypothetical protein
LQLYDSSAALNPKFASGLAAIVCELRVRGTSTHFSSQVSHDSRSG